jgi:hypothetical protein
MNDKTSTVERRQLGKFLSLSVAGGRKLCDFFSRHQNQSHLKANLSIFLVDILYNTTACYFSMFLTTRHLLPNGTFTFELGCLRELIEVRMKHAG